MRVHWVIWFAMALHLVQGFLLLFDPTAGNTTSSHLLLRYISYAPLAGMVMIIAAVMALVELVYFHHSWPPSNARYVALLLPQQAILVMAAGSALEAMITSHFADGVIRSRAFIMADQSAYVLLAIFYSLAIIEVYIPEAIPWNLLRKI